MKKDLQAAGWLGHQAIRKEACSCAETETPRSSGPTRADPRKLGNAAGEVRGSHQSVPALHQQSRAVPVMDVTSEHRASPE